MAIFEPEILKSALFPTFFLYRIIGMGMIEYPIGRPRRILGLIITSTISIGYGIILIVSWSIVSKISELTYSSTAKFAFCSLPLVNFAMITGNLVNYMIHSKEHNHCVLEVMNIDRVMQTMRAARSYQSSLKQRSWQLIGTLFIFFITIVSEYLLIIFTTHGMFNMILVWFTFIYPTYISAFGDIAFSTFNRVMTQYFEDLNSLLESMSIKDPDDYDTRMGNLIRVDAVLEDKKKLEKLRRIRKIYSRLVNLAKRWTKLNGMHVISSTIMAIWIGTVEAFNIYYVSSTATTSHQRLICLKGVHFVTCQIAKLCIIVWPAAAMISEAGRTGKILLSHLQPIAFLRLEVNEFALQLIQNPLRLSAGGLFDLDQSLLQIVITSIATYLVVLVQTHTV